jgi:transcriptional regulator with XRE-family HTH domain
MKHGRIKTKGGRLVGNVGTQEMVNSENKHLGARISALRKAHGLRLAQLAKVCGFSQATLSRIETGQTSVSAHHLFQMAQYLNVDIADFFRDDAAPLTKGMRSITRAGDRQKQKLADTHHRY